MNIASTICVVRLRPEMTSPNIHARLIPAADPVQPFDWFAAAVAVVVLVLTVIVAVAGEEPKDTEVELIAHARADGALQASVTEPLYPAVADRLKLVVPELPDLIAKFGGSRFIRKSEVFHMIGIALLMDLA